MNYFLILGIMNIVELALVIGALVLIIRQDKTK